MTIFHREFGRSPRVVYRGLRLIVFRREEPSASTQEQRQAQILQAQLSPHELAYQESLIQEREEEIREIETGIHELAEIFHDLGTLVGQQGSMLGRLFFQVVETATHLDFRQHRDEHLLGSG
jgi:t-SNARE complex subunit (syntaxin)